MKADSFSDVPNGGVYCLDRSGRVQTVVEHRGGIAGIALHKDGGLIVSGRNGFARPTAAG